MITNGENVSDSSYDYLIKLGARVLIVSLHLKIKLFLI